MFTAYEYRTRRVKVAERLGPIHSPADVVAVLSECLRPDADETEQLAVVALDSTNAVVGLERVYRGHATGCSVRLGELFRFAVRIGAAGIIVCHTHPAGDPAPSDADLALTVDLQRAGRLLDIELVDHLILGTEGRSLSLRASGHLRPLLTA